MSFRAKSLSLIALLGGVFAFTPASHALTIDGGLSPISGLTWNSMDDFSYDLPVHNSFVSQLAPYVEQQAYRFSPAFFGNSPAQSLTLQMFLEITAYEDHNTLNLCGNLHCDPVLTGSNVPGDSASVTLSDAYHSYFTLTGPGGTFNIDPSANADGLDHFAVYRVMADGVVTINPTSVNPLAHPVTLQLFAGDLLVGVEDLAGIIAPPGFGSDRDYNDLFFKIGFDRTSSVPEPTSALLMGLGMVGVRRLRRKSAR